MKDRFVALKKSKTNHLMCKAKINGFSAILLLDSGASNSCIHWNLKDHYQLECKGDPFDAASASQDKLKAISTKKASLQIGIHPVGFFSFVLLDLNHVNQTLASQGCQSIDGILGADFFTKNKSILDYATQKLWL
jgi:hypothetical protein